MTDTETVETIIIGIFGIALVVGIASVLWPVVVDVGGGAGGDIAATPEVGTAIGVPETDEPSDVSGVTVVATRERGASLDGASYIDTPDGNISQSWTVCQVGALASDHNQQASYDFFAYENESITLRYTAGNWTVRRLKNGTNTAASATASSPTQLTTVCGRWNASSQTLNLLVDGNQVASSSVGEVDRPRPVAVPWRGTVDETRVFNGTVSDSQISTLASDPITALPGTERTLRVMYDENIGGGVRAYYSSSNAQFVGDISLTAGVTAPGLTEGTDYEFGGSVTVTPLSGGYLDGAPVVFIDYPGPFEDLIGSVRGIISATLVLAVLAALGLASRGSLEQFTGGGF